MRRPTSCLARPFSALCAALARRLARQIPAIAADAEAPDDLATTVYTRCADTAARAGDLAMLRVGLLEVATLVGLALRRRRVPDRGHRPGWHGGLRLVVSARLAWKRLRGARANAAWATGTLAIGIGLSTAVFSVLDAVLLQPVPYPDADRLAELATLNSDRKFLIGGFYSPPLLSAWRAERDLFDRVEGYDTPTVPFDAATGSETVSVAVVTPGLLPLLDARPLRGRLFSPGEGQTGLADAVLVSEPFWRSRLKGDPDVIGRRLVIDDAPRHVIGVLPRDFRFPNGAIEVWMPCDVDAPPAASAARTFTPVVRLAPARTFEAASAEARSRGGRLSAAVGDPPSQTAVLFHLSGTVDAKTTHALWVLAGAVSFLFLVVGANVANLALSRALDRLRDLAVHAALGASRQDLVLEALLENGLVAALGCLGGLALASALTALARATLPSAMTTAAFTPIGLNPRAVGVAFGLGAVSALMFGVPLALAAARPAVASVLGASRSVTASRTSRRLRGLLVIVEVAVSTALLIGAAVMTRAFIGLETTSRGFDTANLLTVRVGLPATGYRDPASRRAFAADALGRLRQAPGVLAATDGGLPTDSRPIMLGAMEFADQPGLKTPPLLIPIHEVSVAYFGAIRLPILAGRLFTEADDATMVLVSESFAKKYWPGRSVLGARFRGVGQDWQHIIGVVGDIEPLTGLATSLALYYQTGKAPAAMQPRLSGASSIIDYLTFVVRTDPASDGLTLVPRLIHTVDPHVVIWKTSLVDHLYADAVARPRTVFLVMTIFAGVGLLLAMAGMYGVLSHLVTQRVREIGIRFALGARPRDIGGLIVGRGLTFVAVGLVGGLGLAALLGRAARAILTDLGAPDAVSVVAVVVLLGLTAVAAAWLPARRAMRVDPAELLRDA